MRRRYRGGWQSEGPGSEGGECPPRSLSDCPEGAGGTIVFNDDRKSMEMGLFLGAQVEVLRNHRREPSLLVAVGPARYAVARATARRILIR